MMLSFFSRVSLSLGCSSSMVLLYVYRSSLVLQAQQVWPGFSSLGQEPDGFVTQVLHAWITCQLQVSKAHPDWFCPSFPWLSGFSLGCNESWWVSQNYAEVCAMTFYPDGDRGIANSKDETVARWNVRVLADCLVGSTIKATNQRHENRHAENISTDMHDQWIFMHVGCHAGSLANPSTQMFTYTRHMTRRSSP